MTKIVKAYKYRLYPNDDQKTMINKTIGCARFIYNHMLADKIQHFNNNKKSLNNTPAEYKNEYNWLKEVDSQALSQSHQDLNIAYNRFFNKQNKFPKFKKKCQRDSYRSCVVNNNIRIEGKYIKLPKIGLVEIRMERSLPKESIIKNVTVSKTKTNKYFVSIQFENEKEIKAVIPETYLGLDYSMPCFYVDSDGNSANSYRLYRTSEVKLAKEQRKLSKMVRGSNNYKKQRLKLAKIHEVIANKRKDFLHKKSREITNLYDVVCVEDLNMKTMAKSMNFGKSVHDNGWGMFVNMLQYKLEESGKYLVKANKWFPSSKQCSSCGNKNDELKLSDRVYHCKNCGLEIDRDHNAAINLRKYGIEQLARA